MKRAKHWLLASLAVLATMLCMLAVPAVPAMAQQADGVLANADPVSETKTESNLTTSVMVSGEPNGPYTLTFTAQQDDANGVQWAANSTMYLDFTNVITFTQDDVSVPTGVTLTKMHDWRYTVQGYDYAANVGTPLTVTIQNVELNLNSSSVKEAVGPTNLDLVGSTYINNQAAVDVYLPKPKLPMIGVGTTAPTPAWNGKVVSWEENTNALSYEIRYKNRDDENFTVEEVTGTSKDLTEFINEHGAGEYSFQVTAKRGDLSTAGSTFKKKTWRKIGVYPATFNRAGTAVTPGTDGGSVAGTVLSGDMQDAFGAPDEKGRIEGLFADGDVLRLTATANNEHDFIEWNTYEEVEPGNWEPTAPKDNPLEFTVKLDLTNIRANFKKQVPVAKLKLHFGDSHAALAASSEIKQALEEEGFSDVQVNGSTVSMSIPTTHESEDPRSVISVENTLSNILYGVTKDGMDAGERFPPMWGIGLTTRLWMVLFRRHGDNSRWWNHRSHGWTD